MCEMDGLWCGRVPEASGAEKKTGTCGHAHTVAAVGGCDARRASGQGGGENGDGPSGTSARRLCQAQVPRGRWAPGAAKKGTEACDDAKQ